MRKNRLNSRAMKNVFALLVLYVSLSSPLAAQGTSVPVNGQLYGDPIIGTSASGATLTFTQVFVATASGLYGHESSSNEYVLTGDFYYKWYPPAGRYHCQSRHEAHILFREHCGKHANCSA